MKDITRRSVVAALEAGEVIVIPTDTVYGLAARLTPAAIAKLFSLKGRERRKALPVLGADLAALDVIARFGEPVRVLATRFWPGPLTLVLPRADGFDLDLGGEDDGTVAVRVPANDVALEILAFGPLAVTSANLTGTDPGQTIDQAKKIFGEAVAAYVDGGRLVGEPSTVVSFVGGLAVLRAGPVTETEVRQALRL